MHSSIIFAGATMPPMMKNAALLNKINARLLALGLSLSELLAASAEDESGGPPPPAQAGPSPNAAVHDIEPYAYTPDRQGRDVPIYGTVLGSAFDGTDADLHSLHMGDILDYAARPARISSKRRIYALLVASESMAPKFETGDLIYVDPAAPPRIGDAVVVQISSAQGNVVGGLIKTLAKRSPEILTLQQYNPPLAFDVPTGRIAAVHRIIPYRDLFGA